MTNRATVGSFGEKLKREREMRAITLEEIADATKIGTRSLRALEEEQFDLLPGGIFNKGFVRAYARYLGIDEEQAVADYMAALGEQQPESSISEIAEQVEAQRQKERDAARRTGTLWMTLLIGAFIAAGVFGGWKWWSKQQALKFQEQSPAITEPAPAEQPVAPALTPDATQP
ncbi:MAG TPA: helix-turn-helix domain-containing protein, partial [Clostridia bacterium]|nr:helix-turn-helix domain-containing protein [Clostridia bacterium]